MITREMKPYLSSPSEPGKTPQPAHIFEHQQINATTLINWPVHARK